jgi:glycosyltransferase involved in cell wall biosynthesis
MRFGYSIAAMTRISATIITLNEQDRIATAIASLACCDEVIVVDAGSNDRTVEIAAARGARVFVHPWEGYSKQKNYAATLAGNDWILSVDADEQISAELATEITQWRKAAPAFSAMSMPRRALYMGAWIRHSGWYPDRKIRLYDRRKAQWSGDFVHESMNFTGAVGSFSNDLLHIPYRSWADHAERIDRYTRLAAEAARTAGRRSNLFKLLLGPPLYFLKTLIVQAGVLDGWRGLMIAYMGARYVFLREFRILR